MEINSPLKCDKCGNVLLVNEFKQLVFLFLCSACYKKWPATMSEEAIEEELLGCPMAIEQEQKPLFAEMETEMSKTDAIVAMFKSLGNMPETLNKIEKLRNDINKVLYDDKYKDNELLEQLDEWQCALKWIDPELWEDYGNFKEGLEELIENKFGKD